MLTIKELGGWKTLGMVIRYTHLSPDHKRAAVERLIPAQTSTTTGTEENAELAAVDNLLKINSLGWAIHGCVWHQKCTKKSPRG